jgi:ABC-type uncharacterized transport system substrate-binding protein
VVWFSCRRQPGKSQRLARLIPNRAILVASGLPRSARNAGATLARPGGNVTGVSSQGSDTAGKRLELLREVVPGQRRFAVLANLASSFPALELGEVQAASRTLGLEVSPFDIRRAEDITLAFEALKGHAEALYVTVVSRIFRTFGWLSGTRPWLTR